MCALSEQGRWSAPPNCLRVARAAGTAPKFQAAGPRSFTTSALREAPASAFAILLATVAAAALTGSLARWAYRAVVAAWDWPSILPIIGSPIPLDAATLAKAWRKSCSLTSSGPASLRIARQGFSRLTSAAPSRDPMITCGLPSIRDSSANTCHQPNGRSRDRYRPDAVPAEPSLRCSPPLIAAILRGTF